MASPHVAGTAALLLQKNRELGNPDLTQAEVEAILKETAIPIAAGTGSYIDPVLGIESVWGDCPDQGGVCLEEQGAGLLQVDKALDATP
jgi:subtilisin family serine protease